MIFLVDAFRVHEVDGRVCFGDRPESSFHLDELSRRGVGTIISIHPVGDRQGVRTTMLLNHAKQIGLSVVDASALESPGETGRAFKTVEDFLGFIATALANNPDKKVFVHCEEGFRTEAFEQVYRALIGRESRFKDQKFVISL